MVPYQSAEAVAKYLLSDGFRWALLIGFLCSLQEHWGHLPARTSSSITAPFLQPTSSQSDELDRSHDVRATPSSLGEEYTWKEKSKG